MKIKRIKVENVIVPREYHHDELAIRAYEHGFEHGYNRAHIIKLTHESAECLIPAEFCGRGCARAGAAWVAGQAAGYEYYFRNDEHQRRHADAVLDLCDAIDPLPNLKPLKGQPCKDFPDEGNAIVPGLILFMMLLSLLAGVITVGCAPARGCAIRDERDFKDRIQKTELPPAVQPVRKAVAREDYIPAPRDESSGSQRCEVQPKATPRPANFHNQAEAQTADHYFTDH